MTVTQAFPRRAGRLAYVLALSCAAILCAITPALLVADDVAAPPSEQNADKIFSIPDSTLPAWYFDPCDERLKLIDWCGTRDQCLDQGFRFDTNLTQFYQGVASGGKEQEFKYGGKLDYYLDIDGDKAGLHPGFRISSHAETRYGEDINASTGMLTFANFNMAFPQAGENVTGVTKFIVSQSLTDECAVFAGKINTLDDFELNFTGRNGIDRFMNSGIVANIINARTVPYSTYGVGVSVVRDQAPGGSFVVRDPNNHATTWDLDELFKDGVLLSGTVKIPVTLCGLPGNRNFGFNWNSKDYTSVDPSSFVIVPGQGIVTAQIAGSWAAWFNFDQYLWVSESDPTMGWGVFGMTGISDGNPNPIGWNATLGIGGSSLIPGRQRDTFGVGYFHVGLSDEFKALLSSPLAPPGLAQHDEQGVELFYNASLKRWCHLSGDLQIVEPSTINLDTTFLIGLRLEIEF